MHDASIGRNHGLDALRAAACALVVVFHLQSVGVFDFGPLRVLVAGGNTGVFVFFALSGYLLYRPFLRGPVELKGYAIKRAARILPGYYVAFVALLLLTGDRIPIEHPLPFLALSGSYSIPLRDFMGSAWTLSAEILFYLTLPLLARVARGRELPVLLWLAVASMVAQTAHSILLSQSNEWLIGTYPLVFFQFVPGMLLAVLELKRPRTFARMAGWPWLVLGLGLIVVGLLPNRSPILLASSLGGAIAMGWLLQHQIRGGRVLAFLGGMSYALYLWHKDIFEAFGFAGLAIALIGAAASWALVESPILGWAHRIARGRRSTGAQEPTGAQEAVPPPPVPA
jgi:peptidoglycan/LPS O-acetylase OafA/YrhL